MSYLLQESIQDFHVWKKILNHRLPLSFDIEITARCNNNCRHCYINLPANDLHTIHEELTLDEINHIADQAVDLGAVWCLITGGEPLLRKDFVDIYFSLKKKGLLVSLFTNACLINEEHIALFKEYPPRDIEVSVYGVSKETYEKVTRRPGSFQAFNNGLNLLHNAGFKVGLKAMALKSNYHELQAIAKFCRDHSSKPFRFDPILHLRYDQNKKRNEEIKSERLSPEEIVEIEHNDYERTSYLKDHCEKFITPEFLNYQGNILFNCGAGNRDFTVGYSGVFRLCGSLWHPDCVYDLRNGNLESAWNELVPKVRSMHSQNREFIESCLRCPYTNLCSNCPANVYLETGELEGIVPYFCQVAHARAAALQESMQQQGGPGSLKTTSNRKSDV